MKKRLRLSGIIVICILLFLLFLNQESSSSNVAVWKGEMAYAIQIIDNNLSIKQKEIRNQIVEMAKVVKEADECQQLIEQLNMQGRTEEETELINKVITETWDEIQEFLCDTTKRKRGYQWVNIYSFDVTGDGEEEIIISKEFADISAVIAYQSIFDREGNKLLEFTWDPDLESYTKENEEGVFYIRGYIHIGAGSDVWLYGEIRYNGGEWEEHLIYMEWDTRSGLDRNNNAEEGYNIYTGFDEDANDIFKKGVEGIMELSREKEQVGADVLQKYLEGQKAIEKEKTILGCIIYSDEDDRFVGISSQAENLEYGKIK